MPFLWLRKYVLTSLPLPNSLSDIVTTKIGLVIRKRIALKVQKWLASDPKHHLSSNAQETQIKVTKKTQEQNQPRKASAFFDDLTPRESPNSRKPSEPSLLISTVFLLLQLRKGKNTDPIEESKPLSATMGSKSSKLDSEEGNALVPQISQTSDPNVLEKVQALQGHVRDEDEDEVGDGDDDDERERQIWQIDFCDGGLRKVHFEHAHSIDLNARALDFLGFLKRWKESSEEEVMKKQKTI